jgi:NAD(P)H-quinone oxidoreductase subunit 6
MTTSTVAAVVFFALAALTLFGGVVVAVSRNIVRSAFALLATFLGVAGLYAFLSADLVAVVQLMVYVGGVLVVILFAVMLTSRISDVRVSNQSLGAGWGLVLVTPITAGLVWMAVNVPQDQRPVAPGVPTTAAVGDALLGPYVLPFEAISVLLVAALIGAVVLSRGFGVIPRRKRPRPEPAASEPSAPEPAPEPPPASDAPPTEGEEA